MSHPWLDRPDVVVYAHPNGRDYVLVDDDGAVWRWPAEAGGWARRERCSADAVDPDREYDTFQAALALRLSGVSAP